MGQGQQIDHGAAGASGGQPCEQRLEGAGIGLAGKQLVAIDQAHERHGFAPQRVDHVPVIDDVIVLAVWPERRPRGSVILACAPRKTSRRSS